MACPYRHDPVFYALSESVQLFDHLVRHYRQMSYYFLVGSCYGMTLRYHRMVHVGPRHGVALPT